MKKIKNTINLSVIIAIFLSVVLIILGCFFEKTVQNILISFGINVLTSAILFFLIDKRIEMKKQKEEEIKRREHERKEILRYHLAIEVKLPALFLHYNQLVTPYKERVGNHELLPIKNESFVKLDHISQMEDVFDRSYSCFSPIKESALAAFERTHGEVVTSLKEFFCEVDFSYYGNVKKALEDIIRILSIPNCIETMKVRSNNEPLIKTTREWMLSYSGNVQEDIDTGKYSGTVFYQPLMLCYYLSCFASNLNAYILEIDKVKNDKDSTK